MNTELSQPMHAAYTYALAFGGTLTRFPGGLGQRVEWMRANREGPSWGTSTIEGLVRRKYANYSKWQVGRRRTFPIEVTMIDHPEGL